MTRDRKLKRNIKLVYLYNFFHSLIFAYVIERLFWRSRGIDITETVYLEIVYAITVIVLEIPSGLWADRWKRKNLIVIGQFLSMLEILILVFANSFFAFSIAIALAGVSGAVRSGSSNALIYDTLQELGKEHEFEKITGRIRAVDYTSHTIAALIGGLTAHHFGLLINYQMSVVSALFGVVFSMMLIEPFRQTSQHGEADSEDASKPLSGYTDIFKSAVRIIKANGSLRYVMFAGVLMGSTITYMWEFWQNYVEAIGVSIQSFGIVSGLFSIGMIVASSRAYLLIRFMKSQSIPKRRLYQASMITVGICFAGTYFFRSLLAVLLIVIINVVAGISETALEGDIHHSVDSSKRATVESCYSMIHRIVTIAVGLMFGYISDAAGIFSGFGTLGIIVILAFIASLMLKSFHSNQNDSVTHEAS